MAHFAKIENNKVTNVIVIANSDCAGGEYPDSEPAGQTFIASLGIEGTWLQTSYSSSFRDRFASIGYEYDSDQDVFVAPPSVEP